MHKYLTKPINWFYRYGDVTHTPKGPLIFQDNGADILAVAHLDTVSTHKQRKRAPRFIGPKVYTPQLDDRLGVYAILHMLPKHNIRCDVLLTDGEESCASTARFFETEKRDQKNTLGRR